MNDLKRKLIEYRGRFFYLMKSNEKCRLWEIQNNETKFSAQLAEVKPPERTMLMRCFER